MSSRLVKTIHATQVRSIERRVGDGYLTPAEIGRLEMVAAQFDSTIELRRSGLTPQDVSRLEFMRWTIERRRQSIANVSDLAAF